jgi:hypothetical protein
MKTSDQGQTTIGQTRKGQEMKDHGQMISGQQMKDQGQMISTIIDLVNLMNLVNPFTQNGTNHLQKEGDLEDKKKDYNQNKDMVLIIQDIMTM